jgi:protein-L-isoaspartate(D-aspartate) O-methyltransferase
MVAAAATELPEKLLGQLEAGGHLIMPVGPAGRQELVKVTKQPDHYEQQSLGLVSFVPLVHGKKE